MANSLDIVHTARHFLIQSEVSGRVRRALCLQIRTSGDEHFETGDSLYCKRESNNQWHGPDKVIGHEGKQVLVKHVQHTFEFTHVDCLTL